MLNGITIGQYFPGQSLMLRLDAKAKLILTILFIVLLFAASNRVGLVIGALVLIMGYLFSSIPFKMLLRSIRPILPLVIFTSVINLFVIEGEPLVEFLIFSISLEGIIFAVVMALRIILLIAGTSLLTYTTTPIALTDGIESLLSFLKVVKVPVHELAMMMTIALRFIPTLIDETDKIMSAQKARGADIDTGGLLKRVKALIPILIPLFISAFRRAEELALAMECRCYHGGEGRTKMKQQKLSGIDGVAIGFVALGLAGVILINIYCPVVL